VPFMERKAASETPDSPSIDDHAAADQTTPTLQAGMSTALETLRTAPWPLPLHQIIQRGIALLEALLPPAPVSSSAA
jgi:hypothetical protein